MFPRHIRRSASCQDVWPPGSISAVAIGNAALTISDEYFAHAEECVRLAALSNDDLVTRDLLTLRQSYLRTAERLREKARDSE